MKRTITVALTLFLLSTGAEIAFAGDAGRGKPKGPRVVVMTQNQFLGADFTPLIEALSTGDPDLIQMLLEETFAQIAENNFPLRAQALAEQICDRQPAAVGLQEVFRIQGPGGFVVDHLEETMAEIDAQCGNYVVKASVKNVDVAQQVGPGVTIAFLDRNVILVRTDLDDSSWPTDFRYLPSDVCELADDSGVYDLPATGCNYPTVASFSGPFGDIEIQRGYVGVDLIIDDQVHRVVNTHLEVQDLGCLQDQPGGPVECQAAQAMELLDALEEELLDAPPNFPADNTILVGDFNSSPDDEADSPYDQIVGRDYTDIWLERPGKPPGFTCCHEEDLSDQRAEYDERIDLIFSSETPDRVKANVLGGDKSDRIRGLWPSDHGTVNGELEFWF